MQDKVTQNLSQVIVSLESESGNIGMFRRPLSARGKTCVAWAEQLTRDLDGMGGEAGP